MSRRILLAAIVLLVLLVPACSRRALPGNGELVQLWDDPATLDPHLAGDVPSALIVIEVFGGLVTLDTNLKVVPDLAERWTVSANGRTYTFSLREGAVFHDGKAVTAADVKWSIERISDPRTQSTTVDTYLGDIVGVKERLRGEASEVKGVEVIDDRTVAITIDAPKAYFLAKMTYPTAFVLDRENVERTPDWTRRPNGTGPFRMKEYVPGFTVVLERNERYHLGAARLNRVRLLLAGGNPMVMYENNEIHVTGVGLEDLDLVLDPISPLRKEVHTPPPGFQTSYLGFDLAQPPFDDVKVRQALNLAIDRDAIATRVLRDLVVPARGILPPGFPGYDPARPGLRYDLEKARQLLAESKYGPDPRKLPRMTLAVPGTLGAAVGPELQAVLANWRDSLGVTVEIQQIEFATFLRDLRDHRLQMFALAWVADYPDPQDFLDLLFHSSSLNNETRYRNPEVDRLLETARTERDESVRFGLYRKAEETIIDEAPWAPLWHPGSGVVLIKPQVKDYLLLPALAPRFRFVYIEE
ncbi:MAG: peptide ABC transporter substrate-binding protein [Chloroflexi bacterium]|nr:peptide ABC transporter substrate-binding protein [Chloroflexota bacterium]